ncbi:MAG: helix-turn-helix transcriptional regulator [Verrucomicrobia bacterium]|nr:helix-turn-helix transcriptional regulator [Verrucomicrobiota bacterium]
MEKRAIKVDRVFETLSRSKSYCDFEQAFKVVSGIQLSFEPTDENLFPRSDALCLRDLCPPRRLSFDPEQRKPFTTKIEWLPGILEVVIAIVMGTGVIGLLRTGCMAQDAASRDGLKKHLKKRCGDVRLSNAFAMGLPIIPNSDPDGVSVLLLQYADYLARFGNQLLLEQPLCEPATIARARQYIQSHHEGTILLNEVADHVHVSTFYFCKLFKKTTGINFSEFLVRTRIETAKKLLVNRSQLINQVALDAGFQSLTHFNRVFKRLVGVPPRQFRKHSVVCHLENGLNQAKYISRQ